MQKCVNDCNFGSVHGDAVMRFFLYLYNAGTIGSANLKSFGARSMRYVVAGMVM